MDIECVESIQRFAALREQWAVLAAVAVRSSIFTSWDWQFHWWKCYGGNQPLRILVAWTDGRMVGVAPLYVQVHSIAGALKTRLLRPVGTGGDTAPDDLDPLLHPEFAPTAAKRLSDFALDAARDWDVLMMSDLAGDSEFGEALAGAARARHMVVTESDSATIQCVALPERWESFLETLSAKRRSAMRYARKRFESLEGARFFVWSDQQTLDKAIDALIDMHHKRWEGRSGSHSFSSDSYVSFHRELMHKCLTAGVLRLYCLQVNDHLIAMYYCYRFRRGIYHFQSGFDPAFAAYSPGSVLLGYVLEDAIREGNTVFDMLRGDYPHKTKWGTESRRTHCVLTYRRSIAALAYRVRRERLPRLRRLLNRSLHEPSSFEKN